MALQFHFCKFYGKSLKKVAFITDIHFDEEFPIKHGINAKKNWDRALADLKTKNISEIIFGGDIGTQSSHKYFFETLKDFSFKLILGNHDEFSRVSKFFNPGNIVHGLYYSFEDDHNKYLFLDSSTGKINKQQLDWG